MKSLDDAVIDTLVSAFLYEPGLIDMSKKVETSHDDDDDSEESTVSPYVHEPPEEFRFPTFLRSFSVAE